MRSMGMCAWSMARGSPKLLDMPNKLPFTSFSCRETQSTIQYHYDLHFMRILQVIEPIEFAQYKHKRLLTLTLCCNPKHRRRVMWDMKQMDNVILRSIASGFKLYWGDASNG